MLELDPAAAVVARTLDGLFMRQLAIAHNVANVNSKGFTPLRVSFENALQQAYEAVTLEGDSGRLAAVPISASRAAGESVRLDLEISASAENAMRYSMMLGMLDRKLQLMSMAVREGRSQ